MAKRRRARENPLKTRDKALIAGGGIVLLGIITFFATRPKAEKKEGSTASKGSAQNGAQGGTVLSTPKDSRANAPTPPPPPYVSTPLPPTEFQTAMPHNTPNVSWVPGPNG